MWSVTLLFMWCYPCMLWYTGGFHMLNIHLALLLLDSVLLPAILIMPIPQHMPFPISLVPLCSFTHLLFLPFRNIPHPLLVPTFCPPRSSHVECFAYSKCPEELFLFLKYSPLLLDKCHFSYPQTLELWCSRGVPQIVHISSQFYIQLNKGWQLETSVGGGNIVFTW